MDVWNWEGYKAKIIYCMDQRNCTGKFQKPDLESTHMSSKYHVTIKCCLLCIIKPREEEVIMKLI